MTKTAKAAAKPVAEEPIVAVSAMEAPAAARDFVERAAKTIGKGAETLNLRVGEATDAIESAVAATAAKTAEASRAIQGAVYADVQETIAFATSLVGSKTLAEAAQVHVDFLAKRGQVGLARFQSVADFLAKSLQDSAKAAQDNIAKMSARMNKAA